MSDSIPQNISIVGAGNIVVGKGDVTIHPLPPAEERLRYELGILLKNVQTTWIQGVLERSVHEAALLDLGMELREEAVDNPWRMVMETSDQTRQALPRERRIKDVFDEANRLLLILGEPGSGKTTTLLQLARDLIAEVDPAFRQPVPVILNLSTWTDKGQPLDEWLVAELNNKYRLPKKEGRRWLTDRRILPLLDGLDEVRVENRAACVEKINKLVADYGLQGVVVCSRVREYSDLDTRLAFYRAVYLQPLTPEEVDTYLDRAGEKLASLRDMLRKDEALRNMAQSPLILNIMSLAYQGTDANDLGGSDLDTETVRRKHLFASYIARMFSRKATGVSYNKEHTLHWLSWLALNMRKHNLDVFLMEDMQSGWLPGRFFQWIYFLFTRLIITVCIGGIFSVQLVLGPPFIILLFLAVLTIFGLAAGLTDIVRLELLRGKKEGSKSLTAGSILLHLIVFVFVSCQVVSLSVRADEQAAGDISFLLFQFGIYYLIVFGVMGGRRLPEMEIESIDAFSWSWRKAFTGFMIGLIGSLTFVLLVTSILWFIFFTMPSNIGYRIGQFHSIVRTASGNLSSISFYPQLLQISLLLLAFTGPFFLFLGAILGGVRSKRINTKLTPNQGIRSTIKNSFVGGLIFAVTASMVILLVDSAFHVYLGTPITLEITLESINSLFYIMVMAGYFFVIGFFWFGGNSFFKHFILRFILIAAGLAPRKYIRFLDHAADRIFLQKVGGGYRFIHRLLLEHFAEMEDSAAGK